MRRAAFALALSLIWPAGIRAAETHPVLAAIDEALQAGEVTPGEAALYKVLYVTGAGDQLPAPFQIKAEGVIRCATQILADAGKGMPDFPPEIQDQIQNLLVRPPGLDAYIDTEHFRIHYATSGGNMIYGWPDPTYRDGVAEACEISYDEFHSGVNQLWEVPPSDGGMGGGSGLIDCYVTNVGPGIYGYAEWESQVPGGAPYDYTGFFVIDNDYAGFGYPDRLDPARVTIAHEYHHVIQFGYSIAGGGWWMEMCSTWEEDEVFDDINDNYAYLGCYFIYPYYALHLQNGCHEYGTFIWPGFLAQYFNDIDIVEDVWYRCEWEGTNTHTHLDNELQEYSSSLDEAFAEFGRWNFYTGARDDGNHYEEGSNYFPAGVAFDHYYNSYPVFDQHPTTAKRPDRLGTSFMRFNRDTNTNDDVLRITFYGPSTTNAVTLLVKEEGSSTIYEYDMTLDENADGVLEVPFWNQMEYAYMAVSIKNYSYDDQDYAFDAETYLGSTAVSDMPDRIVTFAGNSPNPFYPETTIRYVLDRPAAVRVSILDPSGRVLRTLVDGARGAGVHEVSWNAVDEGGRPVGPGVYFYQVQTGDETTTRKLVLLK